MLETCTEQAKQGGQLRQSKGFASGLEALAKHLAQEQLQRHEAKQEFQREVSRWSTRCLKSTGSKMLVSASFEAHVSLKFVRQAGALLSSRYFRHEGTVSQVEGTTRESNVPQTCTTVMDLIGKVTRC